MLRCPEGGFRAALGENRALKCIYLSLGLMLMAALTVSWILMFQCSFYHEVLVSDTCYDLVRDKTGETIGGISLFYLYPIYIMMTLVWLTDFFSDGPRSV
ncbi:MAG: hypothetical protein NC308_02805 [Clostridium sp.]|nr:hypothetical protein [Clostridium sp.]